MFLKLKLFVFGLLASVMVLSAQNASFAQSSVNEKGVFIGDYTGCYNRDDLVDYYKAKNANKRSEAATFYSRKKCMPLAGRTYVPIRVGFVTASVLLTYKGEQVPVWVLSTAVVASPPPPRNSHFNF